jgi:hypothetical protein
MLCKKNTVAKSKEVKTGCNLAESSKEDCGSKRPVLLLMMTMMIKAMKAYRGVDVYIHIFLTSALVGGE